MDPFRSFAAHKHTTEKSKWIAVILYLLTESCISISCFTFLICLQFTVPCEHGLPLIDISISVNILKKLINCLNNLNPHLEVSPHSINCCCINLLYEWATTHLVACFAQIWQHVLVCCQQWSSEEPLADPDPFCSECVHRALIMSSCGKYELFLWCRDDDASHSHSSMRGLHQHLLDLNHQSYWEKCRGTHSSFYAVVPLVVTTQSTKAKAFSDVQVSTKHDRFALFFLVKS